MSSVDIVRLITLAWLILFPFSAPVSAAEHTRLRWNEFNELRGDRPPREIDCGESVDYDYDYRLTRLEIAGGDEIDYEYNDCGDLTSETLSGADVGNFTFGDALQSVHQTTGPTGAVLDTRFTDAWGNDIPIGGPPPAGPGSRHGFQGREHDSESGLMHFRARTYDPVPLAAKWWVWPG